MERKDPVQAAPSRTNTTATAANVQIPQESLHWIWCDRLLCFGLTLAAHCDQLQIKYFCPCDKTFCSSHCGHLSHYISLPCRIPCMCFMGMFGCAIDLCAVTCCSTCCQTSFTNLCSPECQERWTGNKDCCCSGDGLCIQCPTVEKLPGSTARCCWANSESRSFNVDSWSACLYTFFCLTPATETKKCCCYPNMWTTVDHCFCAHA
jgi:hypothetical protein